MCIIIRKPANKTLSEAIYEECWRINNDGVGLAFVDPKEKKLVVEKGFMNKKDAIEAIKAREEHDLLIHFRKVSKGAINKDNCHPFLVDAFCDENKENPRFTFAIAHNGTFDIKTDKGESDTSTFVRLVLTPWLNDDPWLFDAHYKTFVLGGYCQRSKLLVYRYDNHEHKLDVFWINKEMGNEAHGCWFSNNSWWIAPHYQGERWPRGINGHDHGHSSTMYNSSVDEGFHDHNEWVWIGGMKMFKNLRTGIYAPNLSYREPMQDEYKCMGKDYVRTKIPQLWKKNSAGGWSGATPIFQLESGDATPSEDKNIQVPRDDDVGEKEDWEKDLDLQVGYRACIINHLTKKQKKDLRRLAKDFVRENLGPDAAKELKIPDMINYIRSEFRDAFPGSRGFSLKELDEAILKYGVFDTKQSKNDTVVGAADMGMGCCD